MKHTEPDSQPRCFVHSVRGAAELVDCVMAHLPQGNFQRIMIKPNWVKHEENPQFPIRALVTSSDLLDAIIQACLAKYPGAREITIGDVPLQSCDWDLLIRQSGVDKLMERYSSYQQPQIRFLDLRREKVRSVDGYLEQSDEGEFGDPKGYRQVNLDTTSFLDSLPPGDRRLRVSDYNPEEIVSSHRKGFHRYLIAGSILDSDLFINVPKMKTHQKTGLTGALKNLVGINGQKAYLAHYRVGKPGQGGDEFPPDIHPLIVLQARVRDVAQRRSKTVFQLLRRVWLVLRTLSGIQVEGSKENLRQKTFYIAAGSWYGNDTIWRMVYDLNRIVLYAPPMGGAIQPTAQREYLAILDAMTCGEGNGPLQPLPVELGQLVVAGDPFVMDTVMAQMMGLDYRKVPLLMNAKSFGECWGQFDPETVAVQVGDKVVQGIPSVPTFHWFSVPPGWRHHLELTQPQPASCPAP